MKIFFAAPPGYGLLLPIVPLIWAARASGHEVRLATTARVGAQVAANAGIPVVDVFPDRDLGDDLGIATRGLEPPAEPSAEYWQVAAAGTPFGLFTLTMTEGTIAAARDFDPDVVAYTADHTAGMLTAAALGLPALEVGNRVSWSARDHDFLEEYKKDLTNGVMTDDDPVVAPIIRDLRSKLGIPSDGPRVIARIDPRAPSLGGLDKDEVSPLDDVPWWSMRYVPFNGGTILPDWATRKPTRPRVCVTLGTVSPIVVGVSSLTVVLAALATLDVEVILAAGDVDLSIVGPLPGNVRQAGFLPLSAILPTCSMIVHHGGSGSTAASLHYGVPQLALPSLGDDFISARRVVQRGVGLSHPLAAVEVPVVRELATRLLTSPQFAVAAAEVSTEQAAMPSPVSIIDRLTSAL